MTPLLIDTFNYFVGRTCNAAEASAFLAALGVLPLSDEIALDDWRFHVPMHLLEQWAELSDDERLAIYVIALSATHAHEDVV